MFKGSEWIAFFHAWKAWWAFLSLSFVFLVGGGGARGSSFSNSISTGAGASSVSSSTSTPGAGAGAIVDGSIGSEWMSASNKWARELVAKRHTKKKKPRALFEQWWAISDHLGWPKAVGWGEMREWRRHYIYWGTKQGFLLDS